MSKPKYSPTNPKREAPKTLPSSDARKNALGSTDLAGNLLEVYRKGQPRYEGILADAANLQPLLVADIWRRLENDDAFKKLPSDQKIVTASAALIRGGLLYGLALSDYIRRKGF